MAKLSKSDMPIDRRPLEVIMAEHRMPPSPHWIVGAGVLSSEHGSGTVAAVSPYGYTLYIEWTSGESTTIPNPQRKSLKPPHLRS